MRRKITRKKSLHEKAFHLPKMLEWEQQYGRGYIGDERCFELFDPSVINPQIFEKEIVQENKLFRVKAKKRANKKIVSELVQSLGRVPTPVEVQRERFRQQIFAQIEFDEKNLSYFNNEVQPQELVMKKRAKDFPSPENALNAFRTGKARIEIVDGVIRLIIQAPNKQGKIIDHPVMTDEEIEWVKKSADVIARVMKQKKKSKVFIAGLGLGLLNKELVIRGISLEQQIVAELNSNVITLLGSIFDFYQSQSTAQRGMDIRNGDFKVILQEAIDAGERFDAVSIDAFPNTADEINRDASSKKVLELAFKALNPGGILTFYPDSRYLPKRIYDSLRQCGIPDSSIHYTVARFKKSAFTKQYHYGELMAVIHIQKPLLGNEENIKINKLVDQYYVRYPIKGNRKA